MTALIISPPMFIGISKVIIVLSWGLGKIIYYYKAHHTVRNKQVLKLLQHPVLSPVQGIWYVIVSKRFV